MWLKEFNSKLHREINTIAPNFNYYYLAYSAKKQKADRVPKELCGNKTNKMYSYY